MAGRSTHTMMASVVALATLAAAAPALANTVHFEAESARERERGTITSPLLVKDDPAASGGSYVAVAAGTSSPSGAPASATEGVARYTFSVNDSGSYRLWARVSAPTDGDDSFWIRLGGSASWIKWNGIPLGAAYHWVLVKAEGAASAATFSLAAGSDHELQVAYREDGTKLDAFFVTDDPAFNPNAALAGAPAPPFMQPAVGGATGVRLSWSAVPGATSYTLERRADGCSFDEQTQCCVPDGYQVIATGLTVHDFVELGGSGTYRVTAVAPTGASPHPVPQGPNDCFPFDPSEGNVHLGDFHLRTVAGHLSITSPMRTSGPNDNNVGAPAGTDSLAAPPAHGRARMDFVLAVPTTLRVWVDVIAPNKDQDSFWVRMDDAAWINWNNLGNFTCEDIHDSSKPGSPTVLYRLPAGSHRLEWAPREGGARLQDDIVLQEDPTGTGRQECDD